MVILFTLLTFILVGVGTYLYIELLNNRLSGLRLEHKKEINVLEKTSESYREIIADLNTLLCQ
jgi:hypothetical protein